MKASKQNAPKQAAQKYNVFSLTACLSLAGGMLLSGMANALPVLDVPQTSVDAAFVVDLDWSANLSEQFEFDVELYRNLDGGEFELIASGRAVHAFSQVLVKNGTYGYKVRMLKSGVAHETKPQFVSVKAPSLSYPLFVSPVTRLSSY